MLCGDVLKVSSKLTIWFVISTRYFANPTPFIEFIMIKFLLQESKLPLYYLQFHLKRKRFIESRDTHPKKPIMVVPGMWTSDAYTTGLRSALELTGADVHGWGLGKNHADIKKLVPLLIEKVRALSTQSEPVTMIGWSLGGILSREVARQIPEHVRAVCCIGSPILGGPKYTIYSGYYERLGFDMEAVAQRAEKREEVPLSVPCHAIYSKNDGVVDWEASMDKYNAHTTHAEVKTPHFSMGYSVEVYQEILRWLGEIYDEK